MPSPSVVQYERLVETHIPAILAIEEASNPAPWSERSFRNELDHPQGRFVVARMGDEIVGFAAVWLVVDEAHVINVAVSPEHRRKGIGLGMMAHVLGEAQREGMACATLEVRASNESAIQLYEKLGFERVSVRRGYYPDNREDAVVMWLYHLPQWESPLP